jgi:hypothetical protein
MATDAHRDGSAGRSRWLAATVYAILAMAWVVWAVAYTRPLWAERSPDANHHVSRFEALRQTASAAKELLPLDVAGLAVGAAVGLALAQAGRRPWVAVAAVVWAFGVAVSGIGLVLHLFVMCLPILNWLEILSDLRVAG